MNPRRFLALAVTSLLLVAACGDADDDDDPAAESTVAPDTTDRASATTTDESAPPTTDATTTTLELAAAIRDRTFLSTAVEGFQLVDGTQIVLTFDGDRIGASGGCNQLASTWSVDGDVLVVADMAMTEMACEPSALMDQDTWLAAVLTSDPTAALDSDVLTLTAEGAVLTLTDREVADPDRPIEGTVWQVESLVSADVVSSVPAGVRVPTLVFSGGEVQVDSGCNTGSGTADVGATDIVFGPLATTLMACDEASSQVESQVFGVLQGTVSYTVEADVLTLTNGDQGLVLRAQAEG
jgi:heat shock protein HslJ